jgi:hypothetical protein
MPLPIAMPVHASTPTPRHVRRLLLGTLLAGLVAVLAPAASSAAISTFGSPLSVPATLNTAENLDYHGTNTAVPPSPEVPNGIVHTFHFGADGALWNASLANGTAGAPAGGQAIKVSLEGCAEPAAGGPPPLTQIHFQSLSPLPGGGGKVNLSSQPYGIPVCGRGGASGYTVTSYEPVNLCVNQGDHIALNEEGGFVEHSYQSGVPYRVLGAVAGSTSSSFIRGEGTGNGAILSASDTTAMDGFASNANEELMLRVTLGTGKDAAPICPGGKKGIPAPLAPIRVSPQTDGVNSSRIVAVAVFCRVTPVCKGTATLSTGRGKYIHGRSGFNLPPNKTIHLPIRVSKGLMTMIRRNHGVLTTLTAVVGGKTVSQQIGVKIF